MGSSGGLLAIGEDESDLDDIADDIGDALDDFLRQGVNDSRDGSGGSTGSDPTPSPAAEPRERPEMLPLDDIVSEVANPNKPVRRQRPGGSGGAPGGFSRGNPHSFEPDEEAGLRGEEVVLQCEQKRVEKLFGSSEAVRWVSREDRFADHDIESLDDDGQVIDIEVKATNGSHGVFVWTLGEFALAVRRRKRYVLYREYSARSHSPRVYRLVDPVGAMRNGDLIIEVDRVLGNIGSVPD